MDPIFIKTWPTFGGLALARNRADTVVLFSRGRRYCAIQYGGREGAYNEPRFVTLPPSTKRVLPGMCKTFYKNTLLK